MITCEPQGTTPHSGQCCTNGKSNPAHKGMFAASLVISVTGLNILLDADLQTSIKEEFGVTFENMPYECGISKDIIPK